MDEWNLNDMKVGKENVFEEYHILVFLTLLVGHRVLVKVLFFK